MGKKARQPKRASGSATITDGPVPVVGMREPCPCGSGKRYKQCHGLAARTERQVLPRRPFAGMADEADWVALHSFVPAATASLTLAEPVPGRTVMLCTLLPMAIPARAQPDGSVWIALQTADPPGSVDHSRELATALRAALDTEPGEPVQVPATPPDGPRLQDLLVTDVPLEVTVHNDVWYWADGLEGSDDAADIDDSAADDTDTDTDVDAGGTEPVASDEDRSNVPAELASMIEQVNERVRPTVRLTSVEAAYWVRNGERCYLRWVDPGNCEDEDRALDALARLHAAGESAIVEGARLIGSFRSDGAAVPVWDVPSELEHSAFEEPAKRFADRMADALARTTPLTSAERGARSGLLSRQVTIR